MTIPQLFKYKRLLEFYKELFYKGVLSKEYIIKKYGNSVENYLEVDGKSMTSPAMYNKSTQNYQRNDISITQKIFELENKIFQINQIETNKIQSKFNEGLFIATSIASLITFLYLFFELNLLNYVSNKSILFYFFIVFVILIIFIIFCLITYLSLFLFYQVIYKRIFK